MRKGKRKGKERKHVRTLDTDNNCPELWLLSIQHGETSYFITMPTNCHMHADVARPGPRLSPRAKAAHIHQRCCWFVDQLKKQKMGTWNISELLTSELIEWGWLKQRVNAEVKKTAIWTNQKHFSVKSCSQPLFHHFLLSLWARFSKERGMS